MRTSLIIKLTGLCLIAASVFCGCGEKEKDNDNPILIYARGNELNSTSGRILHTSSGKHFVTLDAIFICSSTREVPADESVRLYVDDALVAAYNDRHHTDYLAAPEGSYELSRDATAIIKSGKFFSSDTVELTITAPEKFEEGSYLLPVRVIPSTYQPSANFGVVYVIIKADVAYFHAVENVTGTQVSSTGWTATADKGEYPEFMFIDNRDAYWSVIDRIPATVTIDFKSRQTLLGIKLSAYNRLYAVKDVSMEGSDDGVNWKKLGSATLLPPVIQNRYGVQFMEFYTPVKAQYLKLTVEKPWLDYIFLSAFHIIVE